MKFEVENAPRTLLVTLTYSAAARERLAARVTKSGYGLQDPRRKEGVTKRVLDDVSASLKRLRAAFSKRINAKLRFVAVVEDHKDGSPHVHMLLHTDLLTKEVRKMSWGNGFIDVRVVGPDAANYVSKYLTKATGGVRASVRYGRARDAYQKAASPEPGLAQSEVTGRENTPLEGSALLCEPVGSKAGTSCILVSGAGNCDLESPVDVAALHYATYVQAEEAMERELERAAKTKTESSTPAAAKARKARKGKTESVASSAATETTANAPDGSATAVR